MPWENTEKNVRSGHRPVEDFQADTLKTITINEKDGTQAIVGKPKGKLTMEIQTTCFQKTKDGLLKKLKNGLKSIMPQKSMFGRFYHL